jgi:hypothetical protein
MNPWSGGTMLRGLEVQDFRYIWEGIGKEPCGRTQEGVEEDLDLVCGEKRASPGSLVIESQPRPYRLLLGGGVGEGVESIRVAREATKVL